MKRSTMIMFAALALGASFIPSSASAGPLQRLFGRARSETGGSYYRYQESDSGTYRRYSYEPGAGVSTTPMYRTYTYGNQGLRSPNVPKYLLPKADPRKYR